MTDAKIYLNVPYAEKDAAKALGAKWDAAHKKWYAPTGKDIALFTQWQIESIPLAPTKTQAKVPTATGKATTSGVFTYAADKNFVAYNGDAPPWD